MARIDRDDADILLRLAELSTSFNLNEALGFLFSDRFIADPAAFQAAYGEQDDERDDVRRVLGYFETVGTLFKHDLLPADLLFDWIAVHLVWERVKPHALAAREKAGEPRLYENFEAMAEADRVWSSQPAPTVDGRQDRQDRQKEIVRRSIEDLWNNRNLAAASELYAPEYAFTALWRNIIYAGNARSGPRLVQESAEDWQKNIPDLKITIDEMLAVGDRVVTRWTWRGTYRSVRPVEIIGMTISRLANGKIVEEMESWDRLGFWQQLGIVPETAELLAREDALVAQAAPVTQRPSPSM